MSDAFRDAFRDGIVIAFLILGVGAIWISSADIDRCRVSAELEAVGAR